MRFEQEGTVLIFDSLLRKEKKKPPMKYSKLVVVQFHTHIIFVHTDIFRWRTFA